ncbi:MAG: hypothetical protein VBE63_21120 [Lamprobacter sp.]|uniref:hypothetical protein n=1 Tax=Lamprobacter sp. TaxID=3100796 RepID=UPI002B25D567|nr:hypothetical protein [Lamprobacter sp.]MEA3642422.1 hypothetical protein [Lamprobacter sp.]
MAGRHAAERCQGKLIYLFLHADDDAVEAEALVAACLAAQLQRLGLEQAPIWVAFIEDREGRIAEHLTRRAILDEKTAGSDGERFRRFIPDEQERSRSALKTLVEDALRERRFLVAGFSEPPAGRLKTTASAIFAAVYPQAPPFPSDGFTTANSSGAKDAVQMAKALLAGHVNLPWIQSQPPRLKNRIDAVLLSSWQALSDNTGEPCLPANPKIRSLCELLQQAHQNDSSRTLLASYRQLIAPPYGMNASSAALLLGLLLALRVPQRAVEAAGEQLTPAQWMTRAFVTRPGRHQLDEAALAVARLRFFDADAETRWRELLERWEATERLDLKVSLAAEAKNRLNVEPLPPTLAVEFQRLSSDADAAAATLTKAKFRVAAWERDIEQAHNKKSVHHALKFGAAASQERKKMLASDGWPDDLVTDVEKVVTLAHEIVKPGIDHYTLTQNCATPQQIPSFREQMESEEEWLTELGYTAQATRHESHKRRVIATVEERALWKETLANCTDYPRQPSPKASTTVLELTDEIKRGEDLLQTLQAIPVSVLSDAEKQAYTQGIRDRQLVLKQAVKEREEALGQLDLLQIDSAEKLQEAVARVEQVRKLFAGRRDEEQINDLAKLLQRIGADSRSWETGEVSVERLAELLAQQTDHQLTELRRWLEDDDIEPPPQWNLNAIYEALVTERIETARRRSSDWMRPRTISAAEVDALDKASCKALESELADAPAYLSDADRVMVDQQLAKIRQQLLGLEAAECAAAIAAWQQRYDAVTDIAALDRAQTENLLRALEQPPCSLQSQQADWQRAALDRLTGHLDQLSLNDLITRIERLSKPMRAELLERLSRLTLS